MKRRKLKPWVIPMLIILTILTIPTVYAFYFSDYESSIISKFIVNGSLSTSHVRATVLTYWVDTTSCTDETDLTTCAISGKSSWNMKSDVINSNWVLLEDGYYYYKSTVNGDEVTKTNIKTSNIALIDSELSLNDLIDEQLAGTDVIPQYEIIYEFIEKDSVENSWGVTYESGDPTIIEIS